MWNKNIPFFFIFFISHLWCDGWRLSMEEVIQDTLRNQWEIYISEMDVEEQRGELVQSKAPFDPVFKFSASQNWFRDYSLQYDLAVPNDTTVDVPIVGWMTAKDPGGFYLPGYKTTAALSLSQKTRIGTEFSLGTEIWREKNPFNAFYNLYPELYDWSIPFERQGNANIFITINQPLLKGFLFGEEAMNEKNKGLLLDSYQNDLVHNISQQLLNAIEAYWDLYRAQNVLKERKRSEEQNRRYYESIEKLIDKNQLAKTELSQALREWANAKADVMIAEREITQAAQKLIFAMGSKDNYSRLCEEDIKLDEPPIWTQPIENYCNIDINGTIDFAIDHRKDVRAIEFKERAADYKRKGALNQILPSLNLLVEGRRTNQTYENDANPFFESYHMKAPRSDLSFTLSLDFPIFSSLGRGKLISAKAEKHRAGFQLAQLKAEIYSDLISAVEKHESLLREIKNIQQAVLGANRYVKGQEKLTIEGLSSIFQLLDSHSKQVDIEIKKIETITEYIKNLVRIKYYMGILVDKEEGRFKIDSSLKLPEIILLQNKEGANE